jgi:hypothetical protein
MEVRCQSQEDNGLYGRIYATLVALNWNEEGIQSVQILLSSHGDLLQTFYHVKLGLNRHTPPATYLAAANLAAPPATNLEHRTLQQRFAHLLHTLYVGYKNGIPAGANKINGARSSMLGSSGVEGALDALAAKGFLVVFDPLSDPRFAPIPHP